ncbi:acetylcholinesterase collagenic tail peptide-like isoform X2 [Trichoplusia ni]|uniref:Acetylcholinesterase collagenic tail peptide-like isoform X2 n=1 Tax=Trichoplusia ni TaxID=7111 RepID=A0A7E5WVR5_TRINI|nr:acetylcholinesterase collagenic tail peptide-like isoform X2 [Trichoplusia ni]
MNFGVCWVVLACAVAARAADKPWRWPEGAASVRIDTKVRFLDSDSEETFKHLEKDGRRAAPQADDVPFRQPVETEGFYNRPPGAGQYPVRVESHRQPYQVDGNGIYPVGTDEKQRRFSDGTLDSLQFCKCVANPDCNPRPESARSCGAGKYLCCYKRPNPVTQKNTEFFNEVEDERPMLLPGQENLARPFPPPPGSELNGFFGPFGPGHGHESSLIGVFDKPQGVLVGPGGPTGSVGPQHKPNRPNVVQIKPSVPNLLVSPSGPTGIIGPTPGPHHEDDGRRSESAQRGVLVGPGGPTGVIGPYGRRGVLVGPGGPTGIIGPGRGGRPGVLVGPGGPTGIIGPGYGCARCKRRKSGRMLPSKVLSHIQRRDDRRDDTGFCTCNK